MKNRTIFIFLFIFFTPFIMGMGAKPQAPTAKTIKEKTNLEEIGEWKDIAAGMPNLIRPHEYGNIILKRYTGEGQDMRAVVFPHWWHRTQFTCKVCHIDVGFEMKAGTNDIKMPDIFEGKWCGACHNGNIAFAATECDRCHSYGIDVKENRNFYEITADYPSNGYGNKIDWVKAIEQGKITPKASIEGKEEMTILDMAVDRPVSSGIMPDVVYPHKAHTEVLSCDNCHPNIFEMQARATPITMMKITQGRYCGRCHGKVSFPIEDCFRCHSKTPVVETAPSSISVPAAMPSQPDQPAEESQK